MKILIITLSAACAAVAGYFGIRYFTRRDLGFTTARKYVRNLAENLFNSDVSAAREAGTASQTTTEQTV
jgi:hypothetical protein